MTKKGKLDPLTKEWYDKLKKAGFKDIEHDENTLIFWDTNRLSRKDLNVLKNAQDYYILAEHFLNDYKFKSNYQKTIWEYHANGLSAREIAQTLNKALHPKKTNYNTVWLIIKELRSKMKLLYRVYSNDPQPN